MSRQPPLADDLADIAYLRDTPVGHLILRADGDQITWLTWVEESEIQQTNGPSPLLARALDQLTQYFEGQLTQFDLPLSPSGSPFQEAVWAAMQTIPYGETRTYGWLAAQVGSHARAVGGACGANPIPILIPCHRVMGMNGKMTGFSGGTGVVTKAQLLGLETPLLL